MHSAVRALPGYNRHDAPAILMDGPSVAQLTEQGRAVTAQLAEPHGTLSDAMRAAMIGLSAAGIPKGIRGQARAAAEDYFYNRLDLSPEQPLNFHAPLPPTLELMPDADVQGAGEHRRDGRRRRVRGAARPLRARSCRSRISAAASRTTGPRRSCCRRASTTASRRSAAPRSPATTAGRTSSTSGPRTARPAAHRGRDGADRRRPLPRLGQRHPAVTSNGWREQSSASRSRICRRPSSHRRSRRCRPRSR